MKKIEEHNIGRQVLCDSCNEDYTDRPDSGGIIFGSNGYCPVCTARTMPDIIRYSEQCHIKATCPPDMSFADFVRDYRGGDGKIQIFTFDSIEDLKKFREGDITPTTATPDNKSGEKS